MHCIMAEHSGGDKYDRLDFTRLGRLAAVVLPMVMKYIGVTRNNYYYIGGFWGSSEGLQGPDT
jgi:hypothetical protein